MPQAERPEFEDQLLERLLRTIGSVLLQQAETVNKLADPAPFPQSLQTDLQISPTYSSPTTSPEIPSETFPGTTRNNPSLPAPGLPIGEGMPTPDSSAPMPQVRATTDGSVDQPPLIPPAQWGGMEVGANATWPFPSPFAEPNYQQPDQQNLPNSRYSTDHEDDATVLSMVEQFGEENRRWRHLIILAFQRIIDDLRVDHAKLSSILRHFEGTRRSP